MNDVILPSHRSAVTIHALLRFQYGALQNQIALGQLATSTAGHHQALFSAAATGYPAIIPTSMAAALSPAMSAISAMSASPASGACSTLFVANLGSSVSEEELREVFRSFPGFCRLRMHNKNGSPVAFVEYQVLFAVAIFIAFVARTHAVLLSG